MYYTIAYLKNGTCLTVLSAAESAEAAKTVFAERNPGLEIVDVWERPDFVPAKSNHKEENPRANHH